MEYILKVIGPFKICGENNLFQSPHADLYGIYIKTIKVKDKFIISYIGETGQSFKKRIKEHLIQTMGGNYRVPDPDDLNAGKLNILWNGLWRKGHRDRINEFIDNYELLAPKIKEYIMMLNIFLIPMDLDTRKRRLIEGYLAKYVRSQPNKISWLLADDIRYITQKKKDEQSFTFKFISSEKILGLPEKIEVN